MRREILESTEYIFCKDFKERMRITSRSLRKGYRVTRDGLNGLIITKRKRADGSFRR